MSEIEVGDTVQVILSGELMEGEIVLFQGSERYFICVPGRHDGLWFYREDIALLRKKPRPVLDSRGVEIRVGDYCTSLDTHGAFEVTGVDADFTRLYKLGRRHPNTLTVYRLPEVD